MKVSFHRDPVDISVLCAELEASDAVVVETSRTNFRAVTAQVEQLSFSILPLAVRGDDGEFHSYLFNREVGELAIPGTDELVATAVRLWQNAGQPVPWSIDL